MTYNTHISCLDSASKKRGLNAMGVLGENWFILIVSAMFNKTTDDLQEYKIARTGKTAWCSTSAHTCEQCR